MSLRDHVAGSEELLASALLGIRSCDNKIDVGLMGLPEGRVPAEHPMSSDNGAVRSSSLCHPDFRGISINTLASLGIRTQPQVFPQGMLQPPTLASLSSLLHGQLLGNPGLSLTSSDMVNGFRPLSTMLVPNSPQISGMVASATAVAPQSTAPTSVSSNSNKKKSSTTTKSQQQPVVVHKDKIESALRSDPQRGKKRENLNDNERQELTRTRNREHARATRVRKKRRYEELMDKETQLRDLLARQELERKRRNVVVELFRARELRIRALVESSPQLVASSETIKVPTSNGKAGTKPSNQAGAKVDHNGGQDMPSPHGVQETMKMRKFDDDMARRIENGYGRSSLAKFTYRVIGQSSGVALDQNDGALATVELALADESAHPLVRGLVYVHFMPQTETFQSVGWTTLEESIGEGLSEQTTQGSSVSLEQLSEHTTQSSSVSLEQLAPATVG